MTTIITKRDNQLYKFSPEFSQIDVSAGTEVEYEQVTLENGIVHHIIRHDEHELKSVVHPKSTVVNYGAEWVLLK